MKIIDLEKRIRTDEKRLHSILSNITSTDVEAHQCHGGIQSLDYIAYIIENLKKLKTQLKILSVWEGLKNEKRNIW